MDKPQGLTPTQVGQYIKNIMDRDRVLSRISVVGELSNYKKYPSGHHYFSLKDSEGAVRCVMFSRDAQSLRFRPENGMEVVASGRISVFPRDGQYQLYCTKLSAVGEGDLSVAFEQLKAKLYDEGLFDLTHKKKLPRLPRKIALITSPAGAAVQDIIRVISARFPMVSLYVVPVRVQGVEAPREIADAIAWVNQHQCADLIITGRGGGSMEDLWAFNEEIVARAIFASDIPIISAVGHEPDVTIADYVADVRAATPSNAGELAVPELQAMAQWLDSLQDRMASRVRDKIEGHRRELGYLQQHPQLKNPMYYLAERRQGLVLAQRELEQGMARLLQEKTSQLATLSASLDGLSPLKVMGRGYAILRDPQGECVTSVTQTKEGDLLHLDLTDGTVICRTEGVSQR